MLLGVTGDLAPILENPSFVTKPFLLAVSSLPMKKAIMSWLVLREAPRALSRAVTKTLGNVVRFFNSKSCLQSGVSWHRRTNRRPVERGHLLDSSIFNADSDKKQLIHSSPFKRVLSITQYA